MEKIALVTGSSRGIGRAVARELARQGWRVCVNYRVRQDCAESLAAELAAEGHAIMTYQADVSQRQQVQAMVRAIQEKAALIGLTRSLASELAPTHIRVNCIAPGVIKTDMLDALPPEVLPQLAEETPLRRLGTPEDIAHAAAFLASEKADFITGQVLTVDGGFIL